MVYRGGQVIWSSGIRHYKAPCLDEVVAWDKRQLILSKVEELANECADVAEASPYLPEGDDPLLISPSLESAYWLRDQVLYGAPLSRDGSVLWTEFVEPELGRLDEHERAELGSIADMLQRQQGWEWLPDFRGRYYRRRSCTQCADGLVSVRSTAPGGSTELDTCGCVRSREELANEAARTT